MKNTTNERQSLAGSARLLTPEDEYHRIHSYFSGSPLKYEWMQIGRAHV